MYLLLKSNGLFLSLIFVIKDHHKVLRQNKILINIQLIMIIVFLAYKLLKIDYKIVWFNIAFRILKNYFIYNRKLTRRYFGKSWQNDSSQDKYILSFFLNLLFISSVML